METNKQQPGAGTPAADWWGTGAPPDVVTLTERPGVEDRKHTRPTFGDILQGVKEAAQAAAATRVYSLGVPESLLEAARTYYNNNVEAVRDALNKGGADAETVNAVTFDYGATLCGCFYYTATPLQMRNALAACKPLRAYVADRYGLFIGLLYSYNRNLAALSEYTKEVKNAANIWGRRLFFSTTIHGGELWAAALYWLQNTGYITAADFAGVEQAETAHFLNYIASDGTKGQFALYTYIARAALNASDQLLETLTPPPAYAVKYGPAFDSAFYKGQPQTPTRAALKFAQLVATQIDLYLERVAEQVAATMDAPTPEETERAKEQAQQAARDIITLSPNCGAILSRDVFGSTDGKKADAILPISAFIADYLGHNADALPTTPRIIEKAVEGINLLQQIKRPPLANGVYTLETNLTEFSKVCEYGDANEKEKQQLFTALRVLHNLYVVVWKPKGRIAINLLRLQSIGLEGENAGKLTIEVTADAIKGKPHFITAAEYKALKQGAKGAAHTHFAFQIMHKGHKKEEALLTEIFGYDTMIFEATGNTGHEETNPEGVKAAREYIRKHKPRDRAKMLKWFEDAAAQGIIKFTRYKGNRGAWVYDWHPCNPPTAEELAAAGVITSTPEDPAPDEQ